MAKTRKAVIGLLIFNIFLFVSICGAIIFHANLAERFPKNQLVRNFDGYVSYQKARLNGLPGGYTMTVPNKNGIYNIYIQSKDSKFQKQVKSAVKTWQNKTNIPMRIVKNKDRAQINIKPVNHYLNSTKNKVITTGETNMFLDTLTYKTHIVISTKACKRVGDTPTSTIMHELGHAMGLEHNDRTDDLMNPVTAVFLTRKFSKYDIKNAKRNYKAVTKATQHRMNHQFLLGIKV